MLHVEFIGLPGSGKSTLHKAAMGTLQRLGVDAVALDRDLGLSLGRAGRDRATRLAMKLIPFPQLRTRVSSAIRSSRDSRLRLAEFLVEHPDLAEVAIRSLDRRTASHPHPDLVMYWMLNLFTSYEVASRTLGERSTLVLDEGFCDAAVRLLAGGFDGSDDEDVGKYVRAIPLPDSLFWVDAPIEMCGERVARRGTRIRGIEPGTPAMLRFLLDAEACIGSVLSRLQEGGVRVVRIPNDGAIETAFPALESQLQRLTEGTLDRRGR